MSVKKNSFLFVLIILWTPFVGASQVRLYENFSEAKGITPPTGWNSTLVLGIEGQDNWNFDDPYYVSPLLSTSSGSFATFAGFFYSNDGVAEEVTLTSPSFSCSNDTTVTLIFEEYFYQDTDKGAVQVFLSNDNGSTWSIIYEEDSVESLTIPSTQKINITTLAANQDSLKLKFRAYGNQSIVWIIDDITVVAGEITPPQIEHTPLASICSQGPYEITATISHPIGISTSTVQYKANNVMQPPINMHAINDTTYTAFIPEQTGFGTIEYQILSVDNTINKNISYDNGDSLSYNFFYYGSEQIPTIVQGFENDELIYTIINPNDNTTWEVANFSGGFGESAQSMFMNFYDYDSAGQVNYFRTHNIELNSVANILRFDLAYAQYIDEHDKLEIRVSADGGRTWSNPIYSKSGEQLATSSPSSTPFIPNSDQWRNEVVDLTSYSNECIQLSFEAISDFGNNLYIDNILVEEAPIPNDYYLGQNFPNPAYNETKIEIGLPVATSGQFNIYDMTGARMYSEPLISSRGGIFSIDIGLQHYPAGLYIYQLVLANKTFAKKMIVVR